METFRFSIGQTVATRKGKGSIVSRLNDNSTNFYDIWLQGKVPKVVVTFPENDIFVIKEYDPEDELD